MTLIKHHRSFRHHIDDYGLPVQSDGDGGDTLQKAGLWTIGRAFRAKCDRQRYVWLVDRPALHYCQAGAGLWRRHPAKDKFWSNTKLTTRDQLLNAFVICWSTKERLVWLATLLRLLLRIGFAQNTRSTDGSFRVPDPIHLWLDIPIRTMGPASYLFWPLLLVTDLIWVLQEIIEVLPLKWTHETKRFGKKTPDDADVDNAVMRFILAYLVCPTPFSWLARKIRSRWQHKTLGQKPWMRSNLTGALHWKHRAESNADPMMAELLEPFTEEYMA